MSKHRKSFEIVDIIETPVGQKFVLTFVSRAHGPKCAVVALEFDTSAAKVVKIFESDKEMSVAKDSRRIRFNKDVLELENVVLS